MKLNFIRPAIFVLGIMALLIACSSQPYKRLTSPSISGTITKNQQAVQGLRVYLSTQGDDKLCYKTSAETTTGPDGEFHLPAQKVILGHAPVAKYFLDEWNLCSTLNKQRINIYSGNRYDMGSVKLSVNLKCELLGKNMSNFCTVSK